MNQVMFSVPHLYVGSDILGTDGKYYYHHVCLQLKSVVEVYFTNIVATLLIPIHHSV